MSLLKNEDITISREGSGGEYVDGHRVSDSDSNILAKSNIQPLNGSDLLQLAESDRLREPIRFYTDVELKENDKVTRAKNSREYEIQKVSDWTGLGLLTHYKAIGLLIDAQ